MGGGMDSVLPHRPDWHTRPRLCAGAGTHSSDPI